MSDFFYDIFVEVFGSAIFILLTVFLSWLAFRKLNRKRIKSFFGLFNNDKIYISLSLIRTWDNKALALNGGWIPFDSWTVAYDEVNTAIRLKEKFNFIVPALSDRPGILTKLFVSDIEVEIKPSVFEMHQLPMQDTIISVGGPVCNMATKYIESHKKNVVTMTDKINIKGLQSIENNDVGFIERIIDKNRCLFYVGGLSTFSTVAALYYLSESWEKLEKKFKNDEFLIVIRFAAPDFKNVVEEMFEKKLS